MKVFFTLSLLLLISLAGNSVYGQAIILDKFLRHAEVATIIQNNDNTLFLAESAFCVKGVCANLLTTVAPQIRVQVYPKEEMFMRTIPIFIEINTVLDGYLSFVIHRAGNKKVIAIK